MGNWEQMGHKVALECRDFLAFKCCLEDCSMSFDWHKWTQLLSWSHVHGTTRSLHSTDHKLTRELADWLAWDCFGFPIILCSVFVLTYPQLGDIHVFFSVYTDIIAPYEFLSHISDLYTYLFHQLILNVLTVCVLLSCWIRLIGWVHSGLY